MQMSFVTSRTSSVENAADAFPPNNECFAFRESEIVKLNLLTVQSPIFPLGKGSKKRREKCGLLPNRGERVVAEGNKKPNPFLE